MKLKSLIIKALMIFLCAGCGEIELRYFTRINPDGSIYKRVVAVGDSSKIYNHPFTFDVNDGWALKYDRQIDSIKGDTLHLAIAERTFPSWQAVQKALYRDMDTLKRENIQTDCNTEFRWFYSYHTYREVFRQRFPFSRISIDDYLNPDEYNYLIRDDSTIVENMTATEKKQFNEEGEGKFWNYLAKSIYSEYEVLLDTYTEKNALPSLTQEMRVAIEDYIRASLIDDSQQDSLHIKVDNITGLSWASEAYRDGYFKDFERQMDNNIILIADNNYKVEVETPGLIYETNASELTGNAVKWMFKANAFQYKDLLLEVKYRTTNTWAFILSGMIVVILLWSILYKRK